MDGIGGPLNTAVSNALVVYEGASLPTNVANGLGVGYGGFGELALSSLHALENDFGDPSNKHLNSSMSGWSNTQLWKAAKEMTSKAFFDEGPFTLDVSKGRTTHGNGVTQTYFSFVLKSFAIHFHHNAKHAQEAVFGKVPLAKRKVDKPFATATTSGFKAAVPLWVNLGTFPVPLISEGSLVQGVFWKINHPLLLEGEISDHAFFAVQNLLASEAKLTHTIASSRHGRVVVDEVLNDGPEADVTSWNGYYPPPASPSAGTPSSSSALHTRELTVSEQIQVAVREAYPSNKRKAEAEAIKTGTVLPEADQAPTVYNLDNAFAIQCDWCLSWRFVNSDIHLVVPPDEQEDEVDFQCHELKWKDGGLSCGLSCATRSQDHCPPNPKDPEQKDDAEQAITEFFKWSSECMSESGSENAVNHSDCHPRDFREPPLVNYYHENYWRYLWAHAKIHPEGIQEDTDAE